MLERRWLLFAAVFLIRAPGLVYGPVDIDETDWVALGQMIRRGAVLYAEIAEKKPPLSYAFYAVFSPLGFRLWPVQLLAMVWIFLTALALGAAAKTIWKRSDSAIAASWLFVSIASANVLSVNAELMLNLPAAAALWFHARAEDRRRIADDIATGAAIAAASLFKHQAGIMLVAILAALLLRRRALRASALIFGFAVPWIMTAAAFAAFGHLDAFLEWNVAKNLAYAGQSAGLGAWPVVVRMAEGLFLFVILGAPVPWILAIHRTRKRPYQGAELGLIATLWLTAVPVAVGGRFYAHYFIEFAPPLALAATPTLLLLKDVWAKLAPGKRRLVLFGLLFPVALHQAIPFGRFCAGDLPAQEPKTRAIADWVRAHTAEDATMFVWGHYSPIYYLSERTPGTRYVNTSVHMGDFDPLHLPVGFDLRPYRSPKDVEATIADLERNRPEIVVDTAPADIHGWGRVPLGLFPELSAEIEARYVRTSSAGGAAVYRRRR